VFLQVSKRSLDAMAGRTESNVRVIVPHMKIPHSPAAASSSCSSSDARDIRAGDYVVVEVGKSFCFNNHVTVG